MSDKESGQLRPLTAGDIAVLCRTNVQITHAVKALARWGIPTASGEPGLLSTPEALLVIACLRRMHDPSDIPSWAINPIKRQGPRTIPELTG